MDCQIRHLFRYASGRFRTQGFFSEITLADAERSIRRRMLYPAELRDHIAVHRVIIDKNRRFVNLQAGQGTVGNTEKVGFCTIAVQRM